MKDQSNNITLEWNLVLVDYYHNFIKNDKNKKDNNDNSSPDSKLYNSHKIYKKQKELFLLDLNYYLVKEITENYLVNEVEFDLRKETVHNYAIKMFPFITTYNLDFKTCVVKKKNKSVFISLIIDKTLNKLIDYDEIIKEINYNLIYKKTLFVNYEHCINKNKGKSNTNKQKYNIIKGIIECYLNNEYLDNNIAVTYNKKIPEISIKNLLNKIRPYFWIKTL